MKKLRRIFAAFCLVSVLTCGMATASAASPEKELENPVTISAASDTAVPYADVIEYKYRYNPSTGKYQYRRWNTTRNCWVDPDWIDMA